MLLLLTLHIEANAPFRIYIVFHNERNGLSNHANSNNNFRSRRETG